MAIQDEPENLPDSISIVWSLDDVADRAGVLGVELSMDEQRQVLQRIERGHDATIGICWDVIDTHIENFVRERSEKSTGSHEG